MEGTMLIVSPSLVGVFSLLRKRMSSSFRYTFTKLRIFPSSVKRCFRNSENVPVRLPSASPTVAALHSMLDCFPVNWRSGVGIKNFTAIRAFPPQRPQAAPTLCADNSSEAQIPPNETPDYIGCAGTNQGFKPEAQL